MNKLEYILGIVIGYIYSNIIHLFNVNNIIIDIIIYCGSILLVPFIKRVYIKNQDITYIIKELLNIESGEYLFKNRGNNVLLDKYSKNKI